MKFKLQSTPEGIIICRILEPLSKAECLQVTQGIEKIITSGKSKVLLDFTLKAAITAAYFEKALRILKAAAVKMGGDIKYVVPDPVGQRIFGSVAQVEVAVKHLMDAKGLSNLSSPSAPPPPLKVPEADEKTPAPLLLTEEMIKLKNENRLLTEKVRELLQIVRQPSTDRELKEAMEHYRKLASEVEEAPANRYIKK